MVRRGRRKVGYGRQRALGEALEPRQLLAGQPPTIGSMLVPPSVYPGGTLTLNVTDVVDPEGDPITVDYYHEINGVPGIQPLEDRYLGGSGDAGASYAVLADLPQVVAADERHTYYAVATDGQSRGNVVSAGTLVLARPMSATPAVTYDSDVLTLIVPVPDLPPEQQASVKFFRETNGMPELQEEGGDEFLGADGTRDNPSGAVAEYSRTLSTLGTAPESRLYYAVVQLPGFQQYVAAIAHPFGGKSDRPQDPYEPNHEPSQAAPLTVSTERVVGGLVLNGVEYYRVTASGPGRLDVELTFPDPTLNSDMLVEILDSSVEHKVVATSVPPDWLPGLPMPPGPRVASVPVAAGDEYYFRVRSALGDSRPDYGLRLTRTGPAAVLSRQTAYKNSALDGRNATPGVVADASLDFTREVAFTPVLDATPRFVNGYDKGINAVVIDVSGLPAAGAAGENISASDFEFRAGTGGDPTTWRLAPAPNGLSVRRGAGLLGSDRVALTWPDRSMTNTWLQVTVKATAATGLDVPDVFWFGNLVGDTGDPNGPHPHFSTPLQVNAWDLADVRRNFKADTAPDPIANPYDHNRDGAIDALDLALTRRNLRRSLAPVNPPAPPAVTVARTAAGVPARTAYRPRSITRAVFGDAPVLA
jgi:hypothetical protein